MRPEKQQLAEDIRHLVEPSPFVFLINYKGLTVDQFEALRTRLDECEAECHVVPNRIFARVLEQTGNAIPGQDVLRSETAMVTGGGDAAAVAKTLAAFLGDHEELEIKGGSLRGQALAAEEVAELAKLPSRDVLLGTLLGVLNAPAQNLVGTLTAAKSGIVYALKAYLDNKEKSA